MPQTMCPFFFFYVAAQKVNSLSSHLEHNLGYFNHHDMITL